MDSDFLEVKFINEVESFLDVNEMWKLIMDEDKLIFFGDLDIVWYCYNVFKKCFVELDKFLGEYMEIFEDFNIMLKFVFFVVFSWMYNLYFKFEMLKGGKLIVKGDILYVLF